MTREKKVEKKIGDPRNELAEVIRQAVQASGESGYSICRAVGIDQTAFGRFMAGNRDLTLATAAKLMKHLGLEVKQRKKRQ